MFENLDKEISLSRKPNKEQPVYEQIRRQLYEIIKNGNYPVGSNLPGKSSLTKQLNVNYRTLNSALELLEKDGIIKCPPNKKPIVIKSFPAFSQKNTKIVLSFVRMVADAFSASISEGINKFSQENDIKCIIADASDNYERFIDSIEHPGSDIMGLLIIPYEIADCSQAIKKAIDAGLQVVFIDRKLENIETSSVCSDHFSAGYQATKHLLQQHGRPVYHTGTVTHPSSCRQWVQGWSAAMNEFNFTDQQKYLFKIETSEAELTTSVKDHKQFYFDNAKKFFRHNKQKKYSIFAGNDYVARGIYEVAEDLGLKIGEDVFLTSISNLPFTERLPVGLSSVEQNLTKVGYEAAKLLYEKLTGILPKNTHRVLPVNLVVRESSLSSS